MRFFLLVVFLLFPFFPATAATQAEQVALSRQIVSLRAQDAAALIREKRGRPVLLFIYASWCPYCREVMESLHQLHLEGGLAGVEPVYLSVDADFLKLSAYLLERGYEKNFTPRVLSRAGLVSPMEALHGALKTNFTGGIPYLAFIGKDGGILREIFGVQDKAVLAEEIYRLSHDPGARPG